jgi:MYXO-CTERM domain-containing protein
MTEFRTAQIDVPEGATELYLMIVNLGDHDGRFTDLALLQQKSQPGSGGTGGVSGSGGVGGTTAGAAGTTTAEPEDTELTPGGGCACITAPPGSDPAKLWLAGLAALALLRRRRR